MRIGCLQFAPQVGDVDNNLNRADAVLSRANPKYLDLLVLPELAFSGYNFQSLEHISPFLEPTASGITSLWARTTALKYDCIVTAGYPEKVGDTTPEYYNSAITVSADGDTLVNYRKSFLYYTDETWAHEGNGFHSGVIEGLGNVAMGICMDLNPYRFESPWTAWEFSHHVLHVQANVVILSMAWLTREDISIFSQRPRDPDMETLSYWLARIEPIIRAEVQGEIIVVFANRCGTEEGGALYAGTSAVLGIDAGEVKVYGILGRGEKELLVVDTDGRAQAKLVSQPNSAASAKPANDIMSDALQEEPNYESDHDSENSYEPEAEYEGVSPVSATDSRLPQAYFGRTNLNLGPSLKSSVGFTHSPSPFSPTFERPSSPKKSRYSTDEMQSAYNTSEEDPQKGAGPVQSGKGRPLSAPAAPDGFQCSFTRNPLGPRSKHTMIRPISTAW